MGFLPGRAILLVLVCSCFIIHGLEVDAVTESQALMKPSTYHAPSPAPIAAHHHHHRHFPHFGAPPLHHLPPPPKISPAAPTPKPPLHHHDHPHNRHAPSTTPTIPPVHSPKSPPLRHLAPTPQHHPLPLRHFPTRSLVAVQGVVYCKHCNFSDKDTLVGASPLPGAVVKLHCMNTKYPLVVKGTTDKNGYFYIAAPKTLTNYGAHKCLVSLFSSPPAAKCDVMTDLHAGRKGAMLTRQEIPPTSQPGKKFHGPTLSLYSVGPFAFKPKCLG